MNDESLKSEENWYGTYYELCLQVGPSGDDARLKDVLAAVWSYPAIRGPWRDRANIGREADHPTAGNLLDPLFGLVRVNAHHEFGCVSHVVREEPGSDWVDLCIPTGMLELGYAVTYPLESSTNPWTADLDRFFAAVGGAVFARIPFDLGVIGEEVSGMVSAATLAPEDCRGRVLLIPDALQSRLSPDLQTARIGAGLIAVGLGGG